MKSQKRNNVFKSLILFALMLLGITHTANADQSARQQYPWEKLPLKCTPALSTHDGGCIVDNWPNFEETIQRVAFLYQTEQFVLLEQAMTELTVSDKTFVSGVSTASAAYWTFRRIMPAPGTPKNELDRINRWRKAIPNSIFAEFAEARYLYGEAWNIRGSGYAQSVSPESWELFALGLQKAEQKLMAAPIILKDTPLWGNLLFAIALDSRDVKSDPLTVFESSVKRWPRYFDFYEVMLTRLVPKWGGSWEQVEAFIDKWSREQKSTEGASLYARLYISLLSQRVTPDETAMQWNKMKTSLVDLTARYPDPRYKNLYASYSCFARDKPSFEKAMRLLSSSELMPDNWLTGHSYDACIRWAGV